MNNTYLTVSMAGVPAYCDRFIANDSGEMLYASFFGGGESTKGVVAGLLAQNKVHINKREYVRSILNMEYESTRLTSTLTHFVAYVPTLLKVEGQSVFVLFGESESEVRTRAYEIMMHHRPTPLLMQWQSFFDELIIVDQLVSFGVAYAAMVTLPDEETLEFEVKNNIKHLRTLI